MHLFALVALVACMAPVAVAAATAEDRFDAAGYLRFEFGGVADPADRLHYGLRVQPANVHSDAPTPAVLEMELDRAGLRAARLGGVDLGRTLHILTQGESAQSGGGLGGVLKGIGLGVGALVVAGAIGTVVILESLDDEDFDPFDSNDGGSGSTQQTPNYCIGPIPPPIGSGCILSGLGAAPGAVFDDRFGRARGFEDVGGGMGDLLPR